VTEPSPALLETAKTIALATNALEVRVFGSVARGEAREDSDVDLLLVLPDDADLLAAAAKAQRSLYPSTLDADIVPMRVSHFKNGESVLARVVAREGVLVYG
jgi:predicted nucleotidyltransferase